MRRSAMSRSPGPTYKAVRVGLSRTDAAARLSAEERAREEIARELQWESETVRGWIERHQQASSASGRTVDLASRSRTTAG